MAEQVRAEMVANVLKVLVGEPATRWPPETPW